MTALVHIDRSWVPDAPGRPRPIRFCSRCGHPGEEPPGRPPSRVEAEASGVWSPLRKRVCERCGMGMMLTCPRDAMPGEAAAFLIVDFELNVSAISERAERYFGGEDEVIGQPLLDLLTSPLGDHQLARTAGVAAQRACEPTVMPVRLVSEERAGKVGTLAARIATCGPPRAALLTVEPSGFGRR